MTNELFTYITVFSGCGGSALGLQQAGGKGLLALDFDPFSKRQNAYDHLVANFPALHTKGCILNEDICNVTGERILELTGLEPGALSIYQSSAPCQGFSSSNTNRDANDLRNDLFFESIKHVKVLQPTIAIFENVAGMTKGAMRGKYFQITNALKALNYNVGTWELKASDYGAPQTRARTWIIGVREDLEINPSVPAPITHMTSIRDVLPHIIAVQQGQFAKAVHPANNPCFTITKTEGFMVIDDTNTVRKPTIEELRVLSTFPGDFKVVGAQSDFHARMGNAVLPLMMRVLAEHLYETVLSKIVDSNDANSRLSKNDDFNQRLLQEAQAA